MSGQALNLVSAIGIAVTLVLLCLHSFGVIG